MIKHYLVNRFYTVMKANHANDNDNDSVNDNDSDNVMFLELDDYFIIHMKVGLSSQSNYDNDFITMSASERAAIYLSDNPELVKYNLLPSFAFDLYKGAITLSYHIRSRVSIEFIRGLYL